LLDSLLQELSIYNATSMLRLLSLLTVFTVTTLVKAADPCDDLDCDVKALLRQWRGESLDLGYDSDGRGTVILRSENQARTVQVKLSDFVYCVVPALFSRTVSLVRDYTVAEHERLALSMRIVSILLLVLGVLAVVVGLLNCLSAFLDSRIKRAKTLKRKTPLLPMTVAQPGCKKTVIATVNASLAVKKNAASQSGGGNSEVPLTVAAL